jgi:hypothetical protein
MISRLGMGKSITVFYSVLRETGFLNDLGFFQSEVSGKKEQTKSNSFRTI